MGSCRVSQAHVVRGRYKQVTYAELKLQPDDTDLVKHSIILVAQRFPGWPSSCNTIPASASKMLASSL